MLLINYVIYFIAFSFVGWVFECTYCSIKDKHYQNRGFLYGPLCPIYGFGAVGIMAVADLLDLSTAEAVPPWEIFLISMVGSAVLEYATSYVLEKKFHAVWWDYSNMPLNLHGRICLPASLLFGLFGVGLVEVVFPWLASIHILEQNEYVNAFAALALMFALGFDTSMTLASLSDMVYRLEKYKEAFNARAEAGYMKLQGTPEAVRDELNARMEEFNARREEMTARMTEYAARLSPRQKYHLKSIRGFRGDYTKAGEQMRIRLKQIHDSLLEKAASVGREKEETQDGTDQK